MALLGVVGALLAAVVVSESGRWLDAGSALARSPLVPVLAGIMAMAVVAVLRLRAIATRHALDRRARVVLVPADGDIPVAVRLGTPDAAAAFATVDESGVDLYNDGPLTVGDGSPMFFFDDPFGNGLVFIEEAAD